MARRVYYLFPRQSLRASPAYLARESLIYQPLPAMRPNLRQLGRCSLHQPTSAASSQSSQETIIHFAGRRAELDNQLDSPPPGTTCCTRTGHAYCRQLPASDSSFIVSAIVVEPRLSCHDILSTMQATSPHARLRLRGEVSIDTRDQKKGKKEKPLPDVGRDGGPGEKQHSFPKISPPPALD